MRKMMIYSWEVMMNTKNLSKSLSTRTRYRIGSFVLNNFMLTQEGYPMVINCVKRTSGYRKDGKKNDVLGRDSKTSPGKVIKSSPSKPRQKVPTKPISLTIKYSDEVQGKLVLLFSWTLFLYSVSISIN